MPVALHRQHLLEELPDLQSHIFVLLEHVFMRGRKQQQQRHDALLAVHHQLPLHAAVGDGRARGEVDVAEDERLQVAGIQCRWDVS